MAIYRLGELVPNVHPDAFVHPDAVVIGKVTLAAGSSVWPSAVLRGDYGTISVGERTSIQDGTVVHAGPGLPTIVGAACVVGHLVHLEGCVIEDHCLIGSGSVVLHNAHIRTLATVGAAALVPGRMEVPSRGLALGVPATVKPDASHPEVTAIAVDEYVENARHYRTGLARLG